MGDMYGRNSFAEDLFSPTSTPVTRTTIFPFDLDQMRMRVLQDLLDQATVDYWVRRANDIAQALPRPGDYRGRATSDEHSAHEAGVQMILRNIECHVLLLQEFYSTEIAPEIIDAFAEVA